MDEDDWDGTDYDDGHGCDCDCADCKHERAAGLERAMEQEQPQLDRVAIPQGATVEQIRESLAKVPAGWVYHEYDDRGMDLILYFRAACEHGIPTGKYCSKCCESDVG